MASTKFNLRYPSSTKPTPIVMIFRFEGNTMKISTGEKILPKDWNKNKEQVRASFTGSVEINSKLKKLSDRVLKIYRDADLDDVKPTPKYIREQLDNSNKPEKKTRKSRQKKKPNFWEFVDSFILEMQSSKAKKTIDSYKACRRNLREFEQWRSQRITFDNIDLDFYYKLVNYLIEEKSYAKNTIGYCIKELKLFLNEATERGLNTNMAYKSRKFKVLREDAENIYLTEQEIDDIYNLDLSNQPPRLDKVRDLFVLACNVGLRISDLKRVNSSNIKEKTINIRTQKTGELVVIPINSRVREILDKYDGAMPPTYSEQKFNDYIKELGKLAEIDEPTNKSMTKAGSIATETKPKYMLITSHTARRSFATNAYKNGVPTIAIMKITGHRSIKTFLNYIKIGKEENAEQIANHPFFK